MGIVLVDALSGSAVVIGTTLDMNGPGVLSLVSSALLGLGAAILAIYRPPLRSGGLIRVGLALSAAGLLGLALLWVATSIRPVPDESPVLYVYVACIPAALLGQVILGIGLLREPGVARLLGVLLVGSTAALVLSWLGLAIAAVGWAGLGLLIVGREADWQVSAKSSP